MASFYIHAKKDLFAGASIIPDESRYYEIIKKIGVIDNLPDWKSYLGEKLYNLVKQYQKENKVFHWEMEFPEIIGDGFEAVVGNPPYVDVKAEDYCGVGLECLDSRNLYSYIGEKGILFLDKNNYFSFIVPMSIVCSSRMLSIQNIFLKYKTAFLNFAERPSKIFRDAEQKITILLMKKIKISNIITSSYTQWQSFERKNLFRSILKYEQSHINIKINNIIPKIGLKIEKDIIEKIFQFKILKKQNIFIGNYSIYFRTTGGRYFNVITNYPTGSSKETSISLINKENSDILTSVLNSSLFFWFYILISNTRDFYKDEILSFPFDLARVDNNIKNQLLLKTNELMQDIENYSQIKNNIKYYFIRKSKNIIDDIDRILAKYYGFNNEELNYIINFQGKYRISNEDE